MKSPSKTDHRTDAEIFTEARHALDQHPAVHGTVRVHVESGVMTLTGSVRWPAERTDAEDAVSRIRGVRRLVNHITTARVVSPEGFEPPDERT